MKDLFIKSIYIHEVRHLKDLMIDIDEKEKKHLVITGKNGSGKTSVLEGIKLNITLSIEQGNFIFNQGYWNFINNFKNDRIEGDIERQFNHIREHGGIVLNLEDGELMVEYFKQGRFIFSFFHAKRISQGSSVTGPRKLTLNDINGITSNIHEYFLQYIVNLKTERSFANDDNDEQRVKELDGWFNKFENNLRRLFDDPSLQLIFNRKEYNFYLTFSNGNKVTFNQLSDGYSALLNIVTELILRMENKSSGKYDMQGIVLIDEIETHLHIDLQKIVLPFLIDFFPNLQFIVTTHSPFVISSAENCVVYDLEQNIRLEDASGYSYDTLIESYFDSDKYSEVLKEKVEEYEKLSASKKLSSSQIDRLRELSIYFEKLPTFYSPELEVKLQQIKLQKLNASNG